MQDVLYDIPHGQVVSVGHNLLFDKVIVLELEHFVIIRIQRRGRVQHEQRVKPVLVQRPTPLSLARVYMYRRHRTPCNMDKDLSTATAIARDVARLPHAAA